MKNKRFKQTQMDAELMALKAELQEAQDELALAYRQFNQALDPELVESCIYQISAVKARCNYLIRSIKARSPERAAADCLPAADMRGGVTKQRLAGVPGRDLLCTADAVCACCSNEEGEMVWT